MAHLVRLIGLLLLLACGTAHALLQPSPKWGPGGTRFTHDTPELACRAFDVSDVPDAAFVAAIAGDNAAHKKCQWNGTVYGMKQNFQRGQVFLGGAFCPANSNAVNAGECKCAEGYAEQGGSCVAQSGCEALAGTSAGNVRFDGGPASGSPNTEHFYCDGWNPAGGGQCVAEAQSSVCGGSDGRWICSGVAVYTGKRASTCDGSGGNGDTPSSGTPKPEDGTKPEPDPGTAAPSACPAGQAPGEVNGVSVCAPMGSDQPTAGPAPGNGSTTTQNPNGSSTTTNQTGTTKCTATSCTTTTSTTTTTRNPDGTTTSSTTNNTSTQSRGEFCAKNPKNGQCGGSGSGGGGGGGGDGDGESGFGGTCAAGFKATSDDAVLNAMAEEQHKRNCELLDTTGDPQSEVAAESAKTGNVTGDNPNNTSASIGPGSIDTSNALGGGSCDLNKQITVRGYSVSLPFGDMLCDPLAMLGNLLVAIAMLLAARIITRG